MADDGFGRLKTLVFIAADKLREGIIAALRAQGFRELQEARSIEDFGECVRQDSVDLIITLNRLDEIAVGDVVRDLRLGLLQCDPFPIVLALLPNADKSEVMATLDSGVDDLLLFPLSSDILVKRIKQFTQDRRPFVVTHDYIGPDRRLNPRANQAGITLIKVPNPVRSRAVGVSDRDIRRAIEEAALVIDRDKLKQNALHLLRLLKGFLGEDETPPTGAMMAMAFVSACLKTCEDVVRRARTSSERDIRDRAAVAVAALQAFIESHEPTCDSRFADLIRRIEGVVNEISAYHGAELRI